MINSKLHVQRIIEWILMVKQNIKTWKYTVYARMMEWWMSSFYLSIIKKNATKEFILYQTSLVCFIRECPGSPRCPLHQPWEILPLHIKVPSGREHACAKVVFVAGTDRCIGNLEWKRQRSAIAMENVYFQIR